MEAEQVTSTQNQSLTNYDYSQLFSTVFETIEGTYTNASGSEVELKVGMLFGRVTATGKLAICKSGSSNGSEVPLGINLTAATVANGASKTIQLAVSGRVNEDKIVLDGTDTLDTDFDGRILRDRIPADTRLILEKYTELTNYENQ